MHSLLLLNGSPRGPRSNSLKMLLHLAEGWQQAGGAVPEVLHLARAADFARAVEMFPRTDTVLMGMPLYADAMPALVKGYLEAVATGGVPVTCVTDTRITVLAFLVQSGFSEPLHSRPLERYWEKLASRMGCAYAGTVIYGGGEALQMRPERSYGKLWRQLRALGGQLATTGAFHAADLAAVAGRERFSPWAVKLAQWAFNLPVTQFYWNGQLKRNGAWELRFAAPYGDSAR